MIEEEYEKLMEMTDAECAELLETAVLRLIFPMGRTNGKNALKIAYQIALVRAINKLKEPEVVYLCKYHKEPHYCKHTHRIEDALNFENIGDNKYMEREKTDD